MFDAVNYKSARGLAIWESEKREQQVAWLIEQGRDVNARNMQGNTPLHYAIECNVVKLLLEAGARVDARSNDGSTPLHSYLLTHMQDLDIVKLLVEAGADVNALTDDGDMPIDVVYKDESEIRDYLLEQGSDLPVYPLHSAFAAQILMIILS